WTVQLLDTGSGTPAGTTTTDATGAYRFNLLPPLPAGSAYRVRVVPPAGWVQTAALPDLPSVSGGDDLGVNAGFFRLASVSGRVFADRGRDGTFGPDDRGLSGLPVELLDGAGRLLGLTV